MEDGAGTTVAPTLQLQQWTDTSTDTPLHFQVLHLEDQLLVWIGAGHNASLDNLHMALQTRQEKLPSTTTLFGDRGVNGDSSALAQRLAMRSGKAVALSCSLPPGAPLLQVVAEKCLMAAVAPLKATEPASSTTSMEVF
mmetsp:Transcript_47732/g.91236  ORF Transcript_47732/g.91236 Transcript_47732/m.91236 type:complete len:139 (+) Transcript_47732:168-584(+)|eukprot:CAMPEP_0114252294 /NCGR_PEP_ID=MMETSP0058-20121206/15757_1 /TAXON_ID=36894 /ORGANISM="Pyramimonas parkeae, CCMP726" /LENGTH=138 /DNA_ID=CAMNT_0001366213 /DNA_START=149 /DNA_END=565 /DNA_ORIENTATION=+